LRALRLVDVEWFEDRRGVPLGVVAEDAVRGAFEVRDALAFGGMRVVEEAATTGDELVDERAVEKIKFAVEFQPRGREDENRTVPLVAPPAK
jgi:hypothetical protein